MPRDYQKTLSRAFYLSEKVLIKRYEDSQVVSNYTRKPAGNLGQFRIHTC